MLTRSQDRRGLDCPRPQVKVLVLRIGAKGIKVSAMLYDLQRRRASDAILQKLHFTYYCVALTIYAVILSSARLSLARPKPSFFGTRPV